MLKREVQVKFRMSKKEYETFQNNVRKSGQTNQSFILNALENVTISSKEEMKEVMEINRKLADLLRQIRGISTNINQMAKVANITGELQTEMELLRCLEYVKTYRKESEEIWRLIRQLISQQHHMVP